LVRYTPEPKGWVSHWRLPEGLPKEEFRGLRLFGTGFLLGLVDARRLWLQTEAVRSGEPIALKEYGSGTRWRVADLTGATLWGIRDDGSLWRWRWEVDHLYRLSRTESELVGRERLAPGTDWQAVTQLNWHRELAVLSADGKVWSFEDPEAWDLSHDAGSKLLRTSKRPKLVLDFAKTNALPPSRSRSRWARREFNTGSSNQTPRR